MTRRGERTRELLLDAAERLFAERGVEGVSLREINGAAGQGNRSAVQFHFGDREGLLEALAARHLPQVAVVQQALWDEAEAGGRRDDPRSLVEVLVRPYAEYVRRGVSERAWVRIAAERLARPEVAWPVLVDHAPVASLEAGAALHEHLVASVPTEVAVDRLLSVGRASLHLCADRARLEDASPAGLPDGTLPFDRWLANLLDMATGAALARTAAAVPTRPS